MSISQFSVSPPNRIQYQSVLSVISVFCARLLRGTQKRKRFLILLERLTPRIGCLLVVKARPFDLKSLRGDVTFVLIRSIAEFLNLNLVASLGRVLICP